MRVFRNRVGLRLGRPGVVVAVFALAALSVGAGVVLAGGSGRNITVQVNGPLPRAPHALSGKSVIVGHSYKNDVSQPLHSVPATPPTSASEMEASPNPRPVSDHVDRVDAARQATQFAPSMPAHVAQLQRHPVPGRGCNCAPPDTNGEVGADAVRADGQRGPPGLQQGTGASVLGPIAIVTPLERLRRRLPEQRRRRPGRAVRPARQPLAGDAVRRRVACPPTSASPSRRRSDATGTWFRYGFHLGTNFFDYPHLGVWPDAYYMSDERLQRGGHRVPGPAAVRVRPGRDARRPAGDLRHDRRLRPAPTERRDAAGRPRRLDPAAGRRAGAVHHVGHRCDAGSLPLCTSTSRRRQTRPLPSAARSPRRLHGAVLDDPGMRAAAGRRSDSTRSATGSCSALAYRRFADGHEALVGNQTVVCRAASPGIRWYEIDERDLAARRRSRSRAPTSPTRPGAGWAAPRWTSRATSPLGFSASSSTVNAGMRYAGRLADRPLNTLAQGEATVRRRR